MAPSYSQAELKNFVPKHKFFVGVDSDGCVFDSMELKQKECFTHNTVKHWNLQAVSKYTREAVEFVNLYSKWRGINRFPALVMVFDLLREREEVQKRGVDVPEANEIREFINSGLPLGNPALKKRVEETNDPVLTQAIQWSEAVNSTISDMVKGVPPFPLLRESLEKLSEQADIIVVSQTPCEALQREWEEHDIAKYAAVIAGQEMGKKQEHLAIATNGRYEKDHVLMIGDAPGDLKAARANDACFFPVNPGHEEESWERFYNEGIEKFFSGQFVGDYEAQLLAEFEKLLPETPPWKTS